MDMVRFRPRLMAHCESFNGAMTFQPWICAREIAYWNLHTSLQWSHDLSAMDIVPGKI